MAINLVTGEIKIILEELTEQSNTISQYEGKIPQIELDIIMANIRKLYERYGDLNELNKKPLTSKPINELPVAEKPVPQPAEDDIPEIKITVNPPQDLSAPVSEEKTDLFDIKNEDSVEKQPEKQATSFHWPTRKPLPTSLRKRHRRFSKKFQQKKMIKRWPKKLANLQLQT